MMKQILLALVIVFSTFSSRGAHITGGDFTVLHIEGNTFLATLKLYRDCASGGAAFDQFVNVTVRDQITNEHLMDLDFLFSGFESVNAELGNSCFTPDVCLEIGTYQVQFDLPDNPNGYYLTKERCCRNALSINLEGGDNVGFVFSVDMPDPLLENSSPQFNPFPTEAFLCVNSLNVIDFGATDPDGDELVYSFTTPVNGASSIGNADPATASAKPWALVEYATGYNDANQIGGLNPMTIDPQTGIISGQPQALGVFTVAVKVEEYRNGVKIGEIRRELQLQSSICAVDLPSIIGTPNNDTVFDVLANTNWCIPVTATDPNEGDTLFLQATGPILDGTITPEASFPSAEGFSFATQDLCWSPICTNVSGDPYIVTVRAFSKGCANEILITTQDIYINVILEPDVPTEIVGPVPESIIDLYNPSTHCFQFEFEDDNTADSLYVYSNSPIYDLPNVAALEFSVSQGNIGIPFCWQAICSDVSEEPYMVDFQIVTTNCQVNDTTYFEVPIWVIVPDNEPTTFVLPQEEYYWQFYDADTFCFPIAVTDANFFDTLEVRGVSELFLLENPAVITPSSTLTGQSLIEGNLCWVPECNDVRPDSYEVTLRAISNSCKTADTVFHHITIHLGLPPESGAQIQFPADSTIYTHFIGDELIDIDVLGNDVDPYDTLSIIAISPTLTSSGGGAFFDSNGILQSVIGNYSWQPDCSDLQPELYSVLFELHSKSCQKNESVEVEVFIDVRSPTQGIIEPIPNVFTPNQDGMNDTWTIENKDDPCLLNFKAQVYDRWGKEVYVTSDPAYQWDGYYSNGNKAEQGTYFRTIEYGYGKTQYSSAGTVEILTIP